MIRKVPELGQIQAGFRYLFMKEDQIAFAVSFFFFRIAKIRIVVNKTNKIEQEST